MTPYPHPRLRLKTYSHLLTQKRMPSDYELLTSDLLYYTSRGFAVQVPVEDWYKAWQTGSPFQCANWEKFRDPRETTYHSYVALQRDHEIFVDGLLNSTADTQQLPSVRASAIGPLRFAYHGMQMVAAYIGSMAPGGRIAIAASFQAADEIRRVQIVARRLQQLVEIAPSRGENSREQWQSEPCWQGLRATLEQLLVTYDWGEAFVALNLCVKPVFDFLLLDTLPAPDGLWENIRASLRADAEWQRQWSIELTKLVLTDPGAQPELKAIVEKWATKWFARAIRAAETLVLQPAPSPGVQSEAALGQVRHLHSEFLKNCGLEGALR